MTTKGFTATQDSIRTDYTRGLNTELWEWKFNYKTQTTPLYNFHINGILSSSRLTVTPDQDKWKDKHQFNLGVDRTLNADWTVQFLLDGFFLSDKQSGYLDTLKNDIQTHSMGIGTSYKKKVLHIPCFIGFKEDRRMGQKDRGLNYKLGLAYRHFTFGSYNNRLLANYEEDFLDQRRNTTFTISYLLDRQFYRETVDTLKANIYHQRRDYYISMSGEIESRTESGQHIENLLTYYMGSGLTLSLYGKLFNRSQRYTQVTGTEQGLKRIRKDVQTEGNIRLLWKTSISQSSLGFRYDNEDQTYEFGETVLFAPYSGTSLLVAPDNQGTTTNLHMKTQWRITAFDSLTFYSSIQRFRYDTPDPENYDDRDELRYRFKIQEVHVFSPQLKLRTSLNLNLLHFVYIFGERSADNNWTRILRFSPSVIWRPSENLRITQTAEVLANYVDYDYEAFDPTVRSYLYRKFGIEDSLWIQLTPRISMNLYYELEMDENGKFLWEDWLEQKLIDRKNQNFALHVIYRPWRFLKLAPGYTFYLRQGYRYAIDILQGQLREKTIDFRSYGPTLGVEYRGHRLIFAMHGNLISTKILGYKKHNLTRLDVNMSWKL
jgi:hypothetical protein